MADSRIRLQPKAFDAIEREVYVGWDDVLQTYYAQVIDGNDANGDEQRTLDLGGDIAEVTDPGRVVAAVRPYADTPDDLGELLNISRVSRMATLTDLRDESPATDGPPELGRSVSRSYVPDSVVTGLSRNDITPILAEQRWDLVDTHALARGQSETYRNADHELVVNWSAPDSDHFDERMMSPIRVDDHVFGVDSVLTFDALLSGSTMDPAEPDTYGETAAIAALNGSDEAAHREADHELDNPWFDERGGEDQGFHSGLGT